MKSNLMKRLNASIRSTNIDETSHQIVEFFFMYGLETITPIKKVIDNIKKKADLLSIQIKSNIFKSSRSKFDKIRNNDIQGLFKLTEGFLYTQDTTRASAAEKVWKILNNYGLKIIRENFSSKSSLIKSMLTDLNAESLKSSLEALPDVDKQIVKLRESEAAFANADDEYINATKKDNTVKTPTELKKEIIKIINSQLLVLIEAYLIDEPEKIMDFAAAIKRIIDEQNTNAQIHANANRRKSAKSNDMENTNNTENLENS